MSLTATPDRIIMYMSQYNDMIAERNALAEQVRELRELAIWMTGCGYDFTQHEYFRAKKSLLSCGPPSDRGKLDEATAYQMAGQALRDCDGSAHRGQSCADRVVDALRHCASREGGR